MAAPQAMTDEVHAQDPETLLDPNLSPEVKDAAVNIMKELDAVNPAPQPDVTQSFIDGVNGNVDRVIDSLGKNIQQTETATPDADTARLIDLFKSGLDGNRQATTPAAPTDNVTQAFLDGLSGIRRNTDTTAPTTKDDAKAIVENKHDKATTAETATIEPASNLVERIDVDENIEEGYNESDVFNSSSDDAALYEQQKLQLEKNKKQGIDYENKKFASFEEKSNYSQPQITIVTFDGVRIRVDAIGFDSTTGELVIEEYKSSKTAKLTKNQTVSFHKTDQEIINGVEERVFVGGTVVGKGKGDIFTKGKVIPKGTKIRIIRPN